jgi:hypothetical protein
MFVRARWKSYLVTKTVTSAHEYCSELRGEVTEEEKKDHARRIGKWWLQASEYSNVYEDEELPEDVTEEEIQEIHALIVTGDVLID